jgi:hypothetical protein
VFLLLYVMYSRQARRTDIDLPAVVILWDLLFTAEYYGVHHVINLMVFNWASVFN